MAEWCPHELLALRADRPVDAQPRPDAPPCASRSRRGSRTSPWLARQERRARNSADAHATATGALQDSTASLWRSAAASFSWVPNAGMSTIVRALRLCGASIRAAHRSRAAGRLCGWSPLHGGFPLAAATGSGFVAENVRYEFIEQASRLQLKFSTGATLHVVWPVDPPAFWAEHPKGCRVTAEAEAKVALHAIGTVTTLTPLDNRERVLSAGQVRSTARRGSRALAPALLRRGTAWR